MSSLPHDIPIFVVGARNNNNCARVSSSPCTPVCKSVSVCFNRRGESGEWREERGEDRRGAEEKRGGEGRRGEERRRRRRGEERRGEERRGEEEEERRGAEKRGEKRRREERTGAGEDRSGRGQEQERRGQEQEQERTGDGREKSKQIFQVRAARMEATKTKPQTRITFLCLLLLDKINRKPII